MHGVGLLSTMIGLNIHYGMLGNTLFVIINLFYENPTTVPVLLGWTFVQPRTLGPL